MQKIPMTREGYIKIESELNSLRTNELKEYLQNLTDAREKGDLSENSEYETAKQSLDDLNIKMSKLSSLLSNSYIVDTIVDNGTVQLLTWVKFKDVKTKKETEYKIVPEYEINLKEGKISPLSPIGKAIIKKKPGDIISVDVPSGSVELEIISVRLK
mgnify:FL=1